MKYIIIIADGSADFPQEQLGGKTPLEAARTPHMDRLAAEGIIGTVRTVPDGLAPGSDVAMMSIVGCDPRQYYTGRAPLEAASMGIALADDDWAARCNLVTITDGMMEDYSAGHISGEESADICRSLNAELGRDGIEFHPGKGYRNLLVVRSAPELQIKTTPPHDIAGQPVGEHLPRGRDARLFGDLMDKSRDLLAGHEVNARRRAAGLVEATSIWLWGQGRSTRLPAFREVYGVSAAVITAVDLVAGICALAGWERIVVPGATGYYDTDYAGKAAAALNALGSFDLVMVHVEAPDEASHNLDIANKIRAIEEIDSKVVAALASAASEEDIRLLLMSDHYTLVSTGAHDSAAVPFVISQAEGQADGGVFSEAAAARGPAISDGVKLIERFLKG